MRGWRAARRGAVGAEARDRTGGAGVTAPDRGPYRPCPEGGALNVAGEHYTCDAMRHMTQDSETHEGWPHSSMAAEAIWGPFTGDPQPLGRARS